MRKGQAQILWPLEGWHGKGGRAFPASDFVDPVPFEEKRPIAVWRGSPTGADRSNGRWGFPPSLEYVVRDYLTGELDESSFRNQKDAYFRLKAVISAESIGAADIKFVLPGTGVAEDRNLNLSLFAPSLRPVEQCAYRYIVSLPGNDNSSSFYWSLASGSVVMRMEGDYEAYADCHFEPWVHYIPLSHDLGDLAAKIEWAESNQDACRQIVANANEAIALVQDDHLREQALRMVVEWYQSLF